MIFTKTDLVIYGMGGLVDTIKHRGMIGGDVLKEVICELEDYIVDTYYIDFEDSDRWTISKAYILNFEDEDKYYRIWQEVGLTEYQESYFFDQQPEIVSKKTITKGEWVIET